jgi:hypothetical protein
MAAWCDSIAGSLLLPGNTAFSRVPAIEQRVWKKAKGRSWLAIDPKALFGERAFEFANLFLNPDLASD